MQFPDNEINLIDNIGFCNYMLVDLCINSIISLIGFLSVCRVYKSPCLNVL